MGSWLTGSPIYSYGRIVTRIQTQSSAANLARAKLVLGCLMAARRPMKLHEIQGILSIRPEDKSINLEKRKYVHHLKELCGSIVEVGADETVDLVHTTARKSVTRPKSCGSY